MSLSVLIPTMPARKTLLARNLHYLLAQTGDYEVIVHTGERRLAEKVNRMVGLAAGTHIVIVDDDDWLSGRYMQLVVPALKGKDFVGYQIAMLADGRFQRLFTHSAEYSGWSAFRERGVVQKCPIRRELAADIPFPDGYYEDSVWCSQVAESVVEWAYIDEPLYYYDFRSEDHDGRDIGRWPYDKSLVRWL